MRREQFEHVVAAAADVSEEREIVVIGSQAIWGSVLDPPAEMLISMEVDIYPRHAPEKATAIEGSLGDGSPFQGTYGYYAQGVGPETAKAPEGWGDRLVRVPIPSRVRQQEGVFALCLEVHDLVLAKCVAERDRDWEFAQVAIDAGLVEVDELLRRLEDLPEPPADHKRVRRMLEGIVARVARRHDDSSA